MLPYYLGAIKIWSRIEVKKVSKSFKESNLVVVSIIDNHSDIKDVEFFLDYYKTLGFNEFLLIVEKGSCIDAVNYKGVSICLFSLGSENNNEYRDLINAVLYRFCVDKWILMTSINEYMVYPYCDTRDVNVLIDFLGSTRQRSISGISGMSADSDLTRRGNVHKYKKIYDRNDGGVKLTSISFSTDKEVSTNFFNRVAVIRWSKKYALKNCYSSIAPSQLMDGYNSSKILTYFLNERDLEYFNITKDPISILKCWPELMEKGLIHDGEWS